MGGGGGGGGPSISSEALEKLLASAKANLQKMAAENSKVLLACEAADKADLSEKLQLLGSPDNTTFTILTSGISPADIDATIQGNTLVVVYTNQTKSTDFLDAVIDRTLTLKRPGFHVRGSGAAITPAKVSAYRWRSITWPQFQTLYG